MSSRASGLGVVCAVLCAAAAGAAAPVRLDLRDPAWELAGDGTVVEEFDGRLALRLKTGSAARRDVEFRDGTIEFALQVTPYRSFSYLYFRMESDGEHEEIYLRAHKSNLPDAIQYTPVYKGWSQWQIYHDERSTAPAPLPPGEWIPVRVVVEGERAAVFVGTADEPRLVIPRLARQTKAGYLALRSFLPRGAPDVYVTNVADVILRPGVVEYEFPEVERPAPPAGRITEWQVSPAFAPADGPVTELPVESRDRGEWQVVSANPDGVVEIERHVTRPADARRGAVLARVAITAPRATTRRLDLGFSDEVSVFLNGRLLVSDDESYSFNLPRRQGLLSGEQLSVYLPLARGDNELVLAVTDRFGGWGLSGQFADPTGLAIEPRGVAKPPPAAAGRVDAGLGRLSWLAGCWRGKAGEECWLEPRGGMMIAVNRGPERDGEVPFFELLRVVEEEGRLVYLAQPGGRSPATPFPAVETGDRRVVFANPEHDFPQRITYWREEDVLRVRVEAQRDGEWQGFEQAWRPVPWPAAAAVDR